MCRKNPGKERAHGEDGVGPHIQSIECDNTLAKCGPRDPVEYHYEPNTYFQERCRAKRPARLQQFTRTYAKNKVERYALIVYKSQDSSLTFTNNVRVVNIPLDPHADYRSELRSSYSYQALLDQLHRP